MPLDRSTRTLIAALLWVAAGFIIMNTVVGGSTLNDWALALLFIIVGAAVYFFPERAVQPGREESMGTQERSDMMAASSALSPVPPELHDPVENIGTTLTLTMEEVGEISEPPGESISHTKQTSPGLVTPPAAPLVTPTVTSPPIVEELPVTVTQGDTESMDTQERSDAMAAESIASPVPAELHDPVENISATPTARLEEADEISGPPSESVHRLAAKPSAQADDLTIVEGIGPKMSAALVAAGIDTFARLAASNEVELRSAIAAAGMRFSPSLPTWPEQAAYAARGDWDGLRAFQRTLTAGRKAR